MAKSVINTASAVETERAGALCADLLEPGDLVLVTGELGSGKTTLIRGACRSLGITGPVTSPTFVIGRLYSGDREVAHLDLYRLTEIGKEDPALLEDYLSKDRVAFVEWPQVAQFELQSPRMRVDLAFTTGTGREIVFEGVPPLPGIERGS